MRFLVMFVTAVCVLFLIKLRWPKKKNFYETRERKRKKRLKESLKVWPGFGKKVITNNFKKEEKLQVRHGALFY